MRAIVHTPILMILQLAAGALSSRLKTMIDMKQAVATAQANFAELGARGGILFEEVELEQNEKGSNWLVTLSAPSPGIGFAVGGAPAPRDYKIFKIWAENGALDSVKIRKL